MKGSKTLTDVPQRPHVVEHRVGRDVVDRQAQRGPPRHDDREDAAPDRDDGHDHKKGRRDGADDVGPDPGAVHDPHERR